MLNMRVRAFTGNCKPTDPLRFLHVVKAGLICQIKTSVSAMSGVGGANEKDTNTERRKTETDG